jgi:hypothetical protein
MKYSTLELIVQRLIGFIRNLLLLTQGTAVRKVVFVVFYQGGQLQQKVKKICDG